MSYLNKHKPVNVEVEGRITDLKGTPSPDEDFSLRILHTNDTHSHLETVVKRMTAIKQERTGNSILLDAGMYSPAHYILRNSKDWPILNS